MSSIAFQVGPFQGDSFQTTTGAGFGVSLGANIQCVATGSASVSSFQEVEMLLHFDGANLGTTFVDNGSYGYTTSAVGDVVTSTTQKKFGTSAFYSSNGLASSYLNFNELVSGRPFVSGDFSIEFFFRLTSLAVQSNMLTFDAAVIMVPTDGSLYWAAGAGAILSGAGVVVANTWYHVAVCRVGNITTLYKDGAIIGTYDDGGTHLAPEGATENFFIGTTTGYIDEFRILRGRSAYNGAFTPPTAAFPNGTAISLFANVELAADMFAQSTITADAYTPTNQLSANAAVAASLGAGISLGKPLSATLAVVATATGGVATTQARELVSYPAVVATITAALALNVKLAATPSVGASIVASLYNPVPLAATLTVVTSVSATLTPAADPFFGNVSLLMHFEGAGSTTFTDSSSHGKTLTSHNSASHVTGSTGAGANAMWLSGGHLPQPSTYVSNYYSRPCVTVPYDSDFAFGSGDFTVEIWRAPYDLPLTGAQCMLSFDVMPDSPFELWTDGMGRRTLWAMRTTEGRFVLRGRESGSGIASNGVYVHYALVRRGDFASMYIDGILMARMRVGGSVVAPAGGTNLVVGNCITYIGGVGNYELVESGGGVTGSGLYDDLRVTKGVARYAGDFAVPGEPFPDTAGGLSGTAHWLSTAVLEPLSYAVEVIANVSGGAITNAVDWVFPGDERTVTGGAISTAESKFGVASLDASTSLSFSTYATWNHSLVAYTPEWTVEFFLKVPSTASNSAGKNVVRYRPGSSSTSNLSIEFASATSLTFKYRTNVVASAVTIATDAWVHVALVHKGSISYNIYTGESVVATTTAYINGTSVGSVDTTSATDFQTSSDSAIWPVGYEIGGFTGFVDGFIVTHAPRYTTTFTPRTAAYASYSSVQTAAVATLTADLNIVSAAGLYATPAATASISAALQVTTLSQLAATSAVVATLTADLALNVTLAATPTAVATQTASVALNVRLAATSAVVATITADVTKAAAGATTLDATPTASASITAALGVTVKLAGAAQTVATLTAETSVNHKLASTPAAVSTITATVQSVGAIAATAAASASMSAGLFITKSLACAAAASASVTTTVLLGKVMAASASACASISADVWATIAYTPDVRRGFIVPREDRLTTVAADPRTTNVLPGSSYVVSAEDRRLAITV